MDEDNNGMISFEELWKGYEEVSEFKKLMEVMDLKREDMATVFNVLETDFNQEVPYLELCQHLGSFFKRDPVIMQSLVRYSVMEVRKVLENEVVNLLQQQTQMLRLLLQEKGLQLPPMPRTSPLGLCRTDCICYIPSIPTWEEATSGLSGLSKGSTRC